MPPSIRRSDDRVSDHVGCHISLRSSLVRRPTLHPCGFAGCASLVLRRTLRPCGVASCARRWGRLCREIRSLRRRVRSVVGIDDQSSPITCRSIDLESLGIRMRRLTLNLDLASY